jgi:hypothetical protein
VTDVLAPLPWPAHRLIPAQFPPIGLFDTVATTADLSAVMDLVGWTNDRLIADRIDRLPQSEWVYGVPNASIVMAAFPHVAPGGMRFNGPELGAWYAADDIHTAAAEVGHHLRREAVARSVATMSRTYRTYTATLLGDYLDIRGQQAKYPDVYETSPTSCKRIISKFRSRQGRARSRCANYRGDEVSAAARKASDHPPKAEVKSSNLVGRATKSMTQRDL